MQLCSPFAEKMGQNAPKLKQLLRRYISCAEKMGQNAPKINATMFPINGKKGQNAPRINANYHRVGSFMAPDENWTLVQKE